MNDIVERYIYDVIRRLPEKERDEVKRELEANISDMLPDDSNEQDIINLLTNFGEPSKLAEQYRQNPRYLISPAMFELYISVLKTVTAIVAGVFACIGALTAALSDSGSFGKIVESIIGAAAEGALQAAFWVTIGFCIADRYGAKQEKWTLQDLPRVPEQKGVKISRSSSIVEMTLSAIFAIIIITMIVRDEWFFVFVRGAEIINPFSQEALSRCIPFIVGLSALTIAINVLKLCLGRWNIMLCFVNIIYNVAWLAIALYILSWSDLFSIEFIEFTKTIAGNSEFSHISEATTIAVFAVIFIGAAIIDIISGFRNSRKNIRENKQLNA